jgi:DNA-binding GntR family transcriptional regulator
MMRVLLDPESNSMVSSFHRDCPRRKAALGSASDGFGRSALRRLQQTTLREQAVTEIRNAIFAGQIGLGQRVTQNELAARLGVSRVPVREAMRVLEQEGLLEAQPNGVMSVANPNLQELNDGIRLRIVLEEFAVQQALERLNDQQWEALCAELQALGEDMDRAVQREDWFQGIELDVAWHTALIDSAQNHPLAQFWRRQALPVRYMVMCDVVRRAPLDKNRTELGIHHRLLEVLRRRDPAECREAIGAHILRNLIL